LLGSIMRYLGHSFRPLLVIIVPILLVCVQMQLRYGYENPRPGDELNVFLKLNPETDILSSRIKLETSPGISVAAPDLRINKLNEIDWRIGVGGEGDFQIRFDINGEAIKRPLSTSREIERIYPVTERASFLGILKYPGEELLNKTGPVLSLRIDYPPRSINLFGLRLHWIIVYFFLAMVFGLLLKRLLKVDF
jgi:hypothetical protein